MAAPRAATVVAPIQRGEGDGPVTANTSAAACLHCGSAVPNGTGGPGFCCAGCEAAYATVRGLGLDGYYQRRSIDPEMCPLKPDSDAPAIDYGAYVRDVGHGTRSLHLMIEGLHCAACVWLIESVLARQPGVMSARVNMTTRRLALTWRDSETNPEDLAGSVSALGYRLVPFDPALIEAEAAKHEKELLRAMAVVGFAVGNVMLLSISVWAGHAQGMGPATRDLLHWISALIALPAIAYAGVPFFRSAISVLRAGRTNMDVPISLAVVLAAAMSLHETAVGALHAYFNSAVTLLFFLLVGRYLDRCARGRARTAAAHLLALNAGAVTVVKPNGNRRVLPPAQLRPGMTMSVAAAERIGGDGRIGGGAGEVDTQLIDGESVPKPVSAGTPVFAGSLAVSGPLTVEVTAAGEDTLLAEIVRLVEAAEHGRGRYVAVADRVAKLYAPIVHGLALATFLGWFFVAGVAWQQALLITIEVLIITCPCALALAVPAVQVIATGRLLRRGILVKSATALERIAAIDTVLFDKTGTLTAGRPELISKDTEKTALALAAGVAASSTHPLSRAIVRAAESQGVLGTEVGAVREAPGEGLVAETATGEVRLGARAFCGVAEEDDGDAVGPELWLTRPSTDPVRIAFADAPRTDAAEVVSALKAAGHRVIMLSGDRALAVAAVAAAVGIDEWHARCDPAEKHRRLKELAAAGCRVLMVGDGLNDALALAAAHASMSPSTAADVSQTAADVVFQGDRLAPVLEALGVARRAGLLVRQNFALAFGYNVLTIPIAVAGLVTPLIAAVAMSASSVAVISNALRLSRGKLS